MERKAFHALLLSLAVIAGAVTITTDAYAQTNTERLITVVDNTNEANSLLTDLLAAVTNGFAQVLEMLGAVDGDLQDIHGDLSAIDGDLQDIHADLGTIHADLEALDSDIQNMANTVGGLGAAASAITSLNQGISANAAAINELNEKLDMISTAVGAVQETVETSTVDPVADATGLFRDDSSVEVAVADFAAALERVPTDGEYEATNTFSCTGDVFLDMVSLTTTPTDIAPAAADTSITVGSTTLYQRTYDPDNNPDTAAVTLNRPLDMDNQFLPAGETLDIDGATDQGTVDITYTYANATAVTFTLAEYVGAQTAKSLVTTDTPSATKQTAGEAVLYVVQVDWFATNSDTTCVISSAAGHDPALDNEGTTLVSLSISDEDSDSAVKAFDTETVDCNGQDTEVRGVTIEAGGFLTQYVTLELMAGGESATVKFDGNSADEDKSELPFRFSGTDLAINGTGINDLLINVSYGTVDKNSCD